VRATTLIFGSTVKELKNNTKPGCFHPFLKASWAIFLDKKLEQVAGGPNRTEIF
jgi:hypothetical protein